MIDVIFLLLVFFLATSSFQLVEMIMPSGVSELPPASGGELEMPPDPTDDILDQVIVKILLNGDVVTVTLNGDPMDSLSELPDRLRAISLVKADVPVIIDPESEVESGVVVEAYDFARQAGLARVFLATRK